MPLQIHHLFEAFPVRNMTSGSVRRTRDCAGTDRAVLSRQTQRLASAGLGVLNAQLPALP